MEGWKASLGWGEILGANELVLLAGEGWLALQCTNSNSSASHPQAITLSYSLQLRDT